MICKGVAAHTTFKPNGLYSDKPTRKENRTVELMNMEELKLVFWDMIACSLETYNASIFMVIPTY